jgi:GNAT superfamily N-acetyltransferase
VNAEDLYGLSLDRFVPERNALARELRRGGAREEAAKVAALRKPSVAAWAVNQLVRTQKRAVEALFEAGDALQAAQADLVGGHGGGDHLRDAAAREREAVDRLTGTARGLLSDEGHELSSAALERVRETLDAAALDPSAREQVSRGCLVRELRHVGLGPFVAFREARAPRKARERRRPRRNRAAEAPAPQPAAPAPQSATARAPQPAAPEPAKLVARAAGEQDARAIGRLLDAFNREFHDPTPGPRWLARRIVELLAQDTAVLLGGEGPDGLAVLRFRPALWSDGLEAYLAELYVVPAARGHGLGRALLTAALDAARKRGADRIELGTSETDEAARNLYESLGFVNRERPPHGPVMFVYEREV